jgi:hypothetical protein
METVLAVLAAGVASVFAFDIGRSARRRPRLHAQVWTVAMAAFALATWALAAGLGLGWNEPLFRIFYLLGAIANIPLLATGSVALAAGERAGRRMARVVAVFIGLGALATLLAPLEAEVELVGIPEGSELFAFTFELGGMTLPGPRVFAVIAGSLGTLVIVFFAAMSAARSWSTNRRLAAGNVLIVLGALAPAVGGSLTAVGEGGGLALSLLVGAALLYTGYRLAVSARAPQPG